MAYYLINLTFDLGTNRSGAPMGNPGSTTATPLAVHCILFCKLTT